MGWSVSTWAFSLEYQTCWLWMWKQRVSLWFLLSFQIALVLLLAWDPLAIVQEPHFYLLHPLKGKNSKQTKNKTNKQKKTTTTTEIIYSVWEKQKRNQILMILFKFNKTPLRLSFNLLGKINIINKTVIIGRRNICRDIPLKLFK